MDFAVFPLVDGGAEELILGPEYYWDNSRRTEVNRINLQRTLSGAAFWQDASGRRLVPLGKIMIFTQREPTVYGYPPEAIRPYRHRYLSIDPGPTVVPLFQRLRADFGSVLSMDPKGEACQAFDELFQRFTQRTFRDRYHELELITLLFTAMYREQVEEARDLRPLQYGSHLIQNQFRNAISVETIAERCGMSREHFMRCYKQEYGCAPGAVLRHLRLENAAFLLRSTEKSVESIAHASGFSSSNVCCRAFRRHFGMTPGQYRERSRREHET
ncbi:MAG: AraC family transcriptional regulator [Puniceicoccaceae bacterium]